MIRYEMEYGKALVILANIDSPKYTDIARMNAVRRVMTNATINACPKDSLRNAVRFLLRVIDNDQIRRTK